MGSVATVSRNHPAATGTGFTRRRHVVAAQPDGYRLLPVSLQSSDVATEVPCASRSPKLFAALVADAGGYPCRGRTRPRDADLRPASLTERPRPHFYRSHGSPSDTRECLSACGVPSWEPKGEPTQLGAERPGRLTTTFMQPRPRRRLPPLESLLARHPVVAHVVINHWCVRSAAHPAPAIHVVDAAGDVG
jgi:hypothetical protein